MKAVLVTLLLAGSMEGASKEPDSYFGPKPGWRPPRKRVWVDIKPAIDAWVKAEEQVEEMLERLARDRMLEDARARADLLIPPVVPLSIVFIPKPSSPKKPSDVELNLDLAQKAWAATQFEEARRSFELDRSKK